LAACKARSWSLRQLVAGLRAQLTQRVVVPMDQLVDLVAYAIMREGIVDAVLYIQ
jgi:hypothetical protein